MFNIKINNDYFDVRESTIEFSIGSHATIYISIDILAHPEYSQYFVKIYEDCKKFNLYSNEFEAIGCFIKSIDTNFNTSMNLTIRCDILNYRDLQTRRHEIIEDILNEEQTSDTNNNIN